MDEIDKSLVPGWMDPKYEEAFIMYIRGAKLDDISAELGIPRSTIRDRVYYATHSNPKAWKDLRDELRMEILHEVMKNNNVNYGTLAEKSSQLLLRWVDMLSSKDPSELSDKEVQLLSKLTTDLDRIVKTALGFGTSNVQINVNHNEKKQLSQDDINKILMEDPLQDIQEADYE